jgi:hypothetical protein
VIKRRGEGFDWQNEPIDDRVSMSVEAEKHMDDEMQSFV